MQIDLFNVGYQNAGTYRITHQNRFFNFKLNLVKDSIIPFIKVNNNQFKPVDSVTVFTGDTLVLSPLPADTVGWSWLWTGPNGYSATSRALTFIVSDTGQKGTYTVTGTDGSGCGNSYINFVLNVNRKPGSPGIDNIKIYPNPSKDGIFNLENCAECKVSVYDVVGKIIYNSFVTSDLQVVDLSGWPRGVYIVKVSSNSINGRKKIVIR
jgi:hypothetical protein